MAQPGRVTRFRGPTAPGSCAADAHGLTPASSVRRSRRATATPSCPTRLACGRDADAAAQHPGRTGREVLQLAATPRCGQGTVDEMLELAGWSPPRRAAV
ncbi:hypothetical protein QJS66_16095 [Kocuria rhizophila]|nr:hypothetical protein QJS66_16095 [Kocuria rhizophila]